MEKVKYRPCSQLFHLRIPWPSIHWPFIHQLLDVLEPSFDELLLVRSGTIDRESNLGSTFDYKCSPLVDVGAHCVIIAAEWEVHVAKLYPAAGIQISGG